MRSAGLGGTLEGMVGLMEEVPRALRLIQRMDRMGISARDLAQQAGVDRESVKSAREGRARPATFGILEATLGRLEREMGADEPDPLVSVIELADGTRVTFRGGTPEAVAQAAADFLAKRQQV